MSSGLYLEHYLDSLETLPIELQRNFTLMRDLDTRAQTLMRNIDCLADEYLKDVAGGVPIDAKKSVMDEIQSNFNKVKEYGDDKVQLAIQTYELVDKHIRRLDSDLVRFENELQDKALNAGSVDDTPGNKKGRKKSKDPPMKKRVVSSGEEDNRGVLAGGRKKNKKGAGSNAGTGGKAGGAAVVDPASLAAVLPAADVLDMPVDPNEPTYCLCHQVSYGEMIGCDNPECPIEWFHFTCVNLTTKPKGKWFCPKCSADRKKK